MQEAQWTCSTEWVEKPSIMKLKSSYDKGGQLSAIEIRPIIRANFFFARRHSRSNANSQLSSRRHVPPETTSDPFPTLYRVSLRAITFHCQPVQPSS
jgi:hypothetical protein